MPNKFTLITLEYPPQLGGIASYLSGLVGASNGAIEIISLSDTGAAPVGTHAMRPGRTAEPALLAKEGGQGGWSTRGERPPRWWRIVGLCRAQRDSTLLISHVFPVGTAAWISRTFFGGPDYVIIFHGTDLRSVKSGLKRILLKLICRSAKLLVVNSQSTLRDLTLRVPGVTPLVILPAVEQIEVPSREDARVTLRIDAARLVVVSVARLVPRKGIDVALQAIAQLQKKFDVTYAVVGNGSDDERLKQIAQECGAHVEWITYASDEEKWDWLAASDVFLLPGREEGGDVEGFGVVFLEAALAGLPVVAGRSGGTSEAVVDGETGILIDPREVEEVQRALEKLLEVSELRMEMGTKAKRRVERDFRWEQRWRQLEKAANNSLDMDSRLRGNDGGVSKKVR